jgi:hypothetical protein
MTLFQKIYTCWFILKHKLSVLNFIVKICFSLLKRAIKHDITKFSKEEFEYVYLLSVNDKNNKFGSKEYYDLVNSTISAKTAHFTRNRHHIEYHESITKMNYIDILEMIADWCAATKRKNGDIYCSVDINSKNYSIDKNIKDNIISTINEFIGVK